MDIDEMEDMIDDIVERERLSNLASEQPNTIEIDVPLCDTLNLKASEEADDPIPTPLLTSPQRSLDGSGHGPDCLGPEDALADSIVAAVMFRDASPVPSAYRFRGGRTPSPLRDSSGFLASPMPERSKRRKGPKITFSTYGRRRRSADADSGTSSDATSGAGAASTSSSCKTRASILKSRRASSGAALMKRHRSRETSPSPVTTPTSPTPPTPPGNVAHLLEETASSAASSAASAAANDEEDRECLPLLRFDVASGRLEFCRGKKEEEEAL